MRNRWVRIVAALAVTALLLTYAVSNVNLTALGEVLSGATYRYIAPYLSALALLYWLKAWRWTLILEPLGRYKVREVTPAMMIGFAANNVLPAHLGEVVRSVWFARRYRQSIGAVLVSQVLERILDVLAVILLFLLAVPWIESTPPAIRASVWLVGAVAAALCAAIAIVVFAPQRVIRLWQVLGAKLPAAVRSRGEAFLTEILRALSSVSSLGRLAVLVANSVLQWSFMGVCIWLSMASIGVFIDPAATIIALTAAVVAVTLPNAPGFVGALQAAFLFALLPFGVSSEAAFAGSIVFMVGNWVPVTVVGGVFLLLSRMNPADAAKSS
jgi:glycosyltransferase 2 family protein